VTRSRVGGGATAGNVADPIVRVFGSAAASYLADPDWPAGATRFLDQIGRAGALNAIAVAQIVDTPEGAASLALAVWPGAHRRSVPATTVPMPPAARAPGGWFAILADGGTTVGFLDRLPGLETLIPIDLRVAALAPIISGGYCWGFVVFGRPSALEPWSDADLTLLEATAALTGVAVARAARFNLRAVETPGRRLDLLARFGADVGHHYDDLLTPMVNHLDGLLGTLPQSDAAHGKLVEVRSAAERAAALTHRLLAAAESQTLRPEIVDLNDAVTSASARVRRSLSASIQLVVDRSAEVCNARVDRQEVEEVVVELARNAVDAMAAGGVLRIGTAKTDLDAIALRTEPSARPGSFVMLVVSDTGPGMDDDTRARAFEPFFTTKDHLVRPGLGLAATRGFVRQSMGHLSLVSGPGEGTTVRIFLPRVTETERSGDRPRPESQPSRMGRRIAG
jgi:signal transduction histidine kinase